MNIKGLLLGSAAALVAVSGARAADAVLAPEPEPVEYVRVCDAYGVGFFYIPGTETCLQISGYVWYQVGATTASDLNFSAGTEHGFEGHGWLKNIEARLNFDARSETEWGTLRSYIRLASSWNGVGDGAVSTQQAFLQLGGFLAGYTESLWVDGWDGSVSNWGSHSWSGLGYGFQRRAHLQYTYKSNGFLAAISLEDDALAGDGYMPDVVAKLAYDAGWGGVWIKGAYDDSADAFSGQIGAQFNIPNMAGSSLRLIGFYAQDGSIYNSVPYHPAWFNNKWSVLASYNHQFTETFGASVGVQYYADVDSFGPQNFDVWEAELSVVWFPVTNFEVRGEVAYRSDNVGFSDDDISGFLRFTRYF